MSGLSDSFQRPINYLRVSVTDRCNLRCVYCMPPEGITLLKKDELLTFEEIIKVARAAVRLGINKIRLTGGEPLVRNDLTTLVREIKQIEGIEDIAMTTNGILLKKYAVQLKEAGLKRINISLDTLKAGKYWQICGFDGLNQVLEGMAEALSAGLNPVKINMVVMRGVNDDEIVDFAGKTITEGWNVRYIELMPISSLTNDEMNQCGTCVEEPAQVSAKFIPTREIKQRLDVLGKFLPVEKVAGSGPAKYFRFPGASGTIGFISPVSEHICVGCNRLRLTADGKLRLCLMADDEIDLREPLRSGADIEGLENIIRIAVAAKPLGSQLKKGITPKKRNMVQIGG